MHIERVDPQASDHGLGTIHEHAARYLFARRFAAGRRVIDVGCGTGYGTECLKEGGARSIVGMDVSPEALQLARKRVIHDGSLAHLVQGDGRRIPLASDSVDLAVAFEILEHLKEGEPFIRELRRVIRPDGLLIISTPVEDLAASAANPFHLTEYSYESLHHLISCEFGAVVILRQIQRTIFAFSPVPGNDASELPPAAQLACRDSRVVDTATEIPWTAAAPKSGSGSSADIPFLVALAARDEAALKEAMGHADTPKGLFSVEGKSELDELREYAAGLEKKLAEVVSICHKQQELIKKRNRT